MCSGGNSCAGCHHHSNIIAFLQVLHLLLARLNQFANCFSRFRRVSTMPERPGLVAHVYRALVPSVLLFGPPLERKSFQVVLDEFLDLLRLQRIIELCRESIQDQSVEIARVSLENYNVNGPDECSYFFRVGNMSQAVIKIDCRTGCAQSPDLFIGYIGFDSVVSVLYRSRSLTGMRGSCDNSILH